ncbi:MAG: LysM peptidoglycan-binding domain-containing protein [Spirochaeta sp.]|nr:LysM peptidoglycan-binding domain-containing protein [Spirochaeta sp.]
MKKKLAILCALGLVLAVSLPAQNLLRETSEYQQAQDLRQQAEEAFEEGEYNRAVELSAEAEDYARQAEVAARHLWWGYRARSARTRTERGITRVRNIEEPLNHPDRFEEAQDKFEEGSELIEEEEFETAFDLFQDALALLDGLSGDEDVLPQYYTVRRIPEKRDSFWRIAEYDFVYDDGFEWQRLYEANKDVIQDPDNPRLIQPGQRLRIPERDGETRRGEWQP